jgi:aquaporin Z
MLLCLRARSHRLGFKATANSWEIFVTFLRMPPQIAQVEKHMSTPQQVSATPTSVRTQNEFIGSSSEPGIEPVERSRASISLHWPEYAMEGALLGLFMISACVFTAILQLPNSPIHEAVYSPVLRRVLTGVAMGLTAIVLIYSPWGQRSGAHFNPSVTLTFLRLGKIKRVDAGLYFLFQFVGAAVGVLVAAIFLRSRISDPSVQYAATYPGSSGAAAAALGEFLISFVQMSLVLAVSNLPRFNRLTGVLAGFMVATYITLESPYSGMSMNPARTFGSALPSGIWHGFLIYLLIPPIAMLAAARVFVWRRGRSAVHCCKLDHSPKRDCIFCGMKGTAHE